MARPVRLFLSLLTLSLISAGCNLNAAPGAAAISGAPLVQISAPQPGATYLEGVEVNIAAQVSNAGADIDRVEFAIDESLVETISEANPQGAAVFGVNHTWQAAGLGEHRIAVTAFRRDGSASETALVAIIVIAGGDVNTGATQPGLPTASIQATPSTQATRFVLPTVTPLGGQGGEPPTAPPSSEPTTAAPTAQPTAAAAAAPIASFSQGVNVRRGPGLEFDPPIGAYAAGQTAEILAVSTGGDWYKVRYGGGEGWVYGQLTTVTGDTSALPREAGPPRPTPRPATATPVLPTGAPASGANLVAGIVVLNPAAPVCAQTFVVGLDVANLGTEPTSASGTVTLNDVRAADGSAQGSTIGGFPILQPGQTVRIDMPLTISTWYNETHRITLTIDQENLIAESNPNDNAVSLEYFLDKGGCP
ncbi:MAG: SH3 domain-containing protein [Anaerolineae bacterium]|nr:SH3 domain-containing protein [Anaerolineae bacterium]